MFMETGVNARHGEKVKWIHKAKDSDDEHYFRMVLAQVSKENQVCAFERELGQTWECSGCRVTLRIGAH